MKQADPLLQELYALRAKTDWSPEEQAIFARIQETEGLTRIQAIHAWRRRSRGGVYRDPQEVKDGRQLGIFQ